MRSAAELDAYAARCNLGYFYDVGIGVRRNRNAAMYWYRSAFRSGSASAANNIGTIYRDEMKTSLALRWFQKAAALGDIEANLEIARLHLNRLRDQQAAIRHLKLVIKGEPGVDITRAGYEEASALMEKLQRRSGKKLAIR